MNSVLDALLLIVSLGVFIAIIYGPWQTFCVDRARQEIFEARAKLFVLAASGQISFESPEYRELRSGLEGLIRFAHKITWLRILLIRPVVRKISGQSPISIAISQIADEEVRSVVSQEVARAQRAIVVLFLARSPVLWLFYVVALIGRHLNDGLDEMAKAIIASIKSDAESGANLIDERRGNTKRQWVKA